MKKIVSLIFALALYAIPASANTNDPWMNLLLQIVEQGQVIENNFGQFRSLSRVVPNDETQPRQADYMTAAGYVDTEGTYVMIEVAGNAETWTLDKEGNWNIDQWFFFANKDGSLNRVTHNLVIKSANERVTITEMPVGTAEEQAARWDKFLKSWYPQN